MATKAAHYVQAMCILFSACSPGMQPSTKTTNESLPFAPRVKLFFLLSIFSDVCARLAHKSPHLQQTDIEIASFDPLGRDVMALLISGSYSTVLSRVLPFYIQCLQWI